jgi:hypothetical protein
MMQLVADVGGREPVDHPGVCHGVGVQIHCCEVIRLADPGTCKMDHTQPMNAKFPTIPGPHIYSPARGFCVSSEIP